jgi:hypothetical protein
VLQTRPFQKLSGEVEPLYLRSHNPKTSVATGCSALQIWLIYADCLAEGCSPFLRVAPWVVSAVVSNGIANRFGRSTCRTEYPVGRDELLQDLTRAVGLPVCRDEGDVCCPTSSRSTQAECCKRPWGVRLSRDWVDDPTLQRIASGTGGLETRSPAASMRDAVGTQSGRDRFYFLSRACPTRPPELVRFGSG